MFSKVSQIFVLLSHPPTQSPKYTHNNYCKNNNQCYYSYHFKTRSPQGPLNMCHLCCVTLWNYPQWKLILQANSNRLAKIIKVRQSLYFLLFAKSREYYHLLYVLARKKKKKCSKMAMLRCIVHQNSLLFQWSFKTIIKGIQLFQLVNQETKTFSKPTLEFMVSIWGKIIHRLNHTFGSPWATSLVRITSKGWATVEERQPATPPQTKWDTV